MMNARHDPTHQKVWELLPWYANGTLEAEEHGRVNRHLSSCLVCRKEIDYLSGLQQTIRNSDGSVYAPQRSLASVLARIEAAEAGGPGKRPWWKAMTGRIAGIRPWFVTHPVATRLVVAQAALIVMLTAGVFWLSSGEPEPSYRTLAHPPATTADERPRIRLVFSPETPAGEISEVLGGVHARILDGPSATGIYTIELERAGDDATAAPVALEQLRAHPAVEFAEPVFGTGELR